ncbi:hypothetical protein F3Y22_tig00110783pilonHSYRG00269 [Hibiscus syriacus]|uniref:Uncharacterized protein n=1 Tax=Hibiscus syriacus TaxID=106335 RepID=A0A6A2ZTF1_HIBSY|nr:hypothetical protein F3Y22_tig00110783pilonHSYRG00269 [Hibiscus syriacus]
MRDNNNKTLTAILAALSRLTTQVERFDEIVRERQEPQLDLPNHNPKPNNVELLVPRREQLHFQAPELFAKPKFTIPSFKGDNDPDRSLIEEYYKEMQSLLNKANITKKKEVTVSRFVVGLNSNITDLLNLQGYENLEDTLKKAMTIQAQIQRRSRFSEHYQGTSSSYKGNPSNPSSSSTPSSLKKPRDDKLDKEKERPTKNDTLSAPKDQMIICEEVGKAKKEKAEKEAKAKEVTSYKSQKNNDPWEDFREVLGNPPNGLPLLRGKQHQTNLIQGSIIPRQAYNLEETKKLDLLQKGYIQESLSRDAILMTNHDLNNSIGKTLEVVIHTKHNSFKCVTDRDSRTNPFEEWGNDTCLRVHNTCFFGLLFLLEPIRRTKSRRFKAYLFDSRKNLFEEREDDTCITRLTSREEEWKKAVSVKEMQEAVSVMDLLHVYVRVVPPGPFSLAVQWFSIAFECWGLLVRYCLHDMVVKLLAAVASATSAFVPGDATLVALFLCKIGSWIYSYL